MAGNERKIIMESYRHFIPMLIFIRIISGSEFDKYPLWVAHYYEEQQQRIARDWAFWQHNDQGNINGITSKVDFNVFKGDSMQFKEILIH